MVLFVWLLSSLSVGICRQTTTSDTNILTRIIYEALTSAGIMGKDDGADANHDGSRKWDSQNLMDGPGNMYTANNFHYNLTQKKLKNTDFVEAASGLGMNGGSSAMSDFFLKYPDKAADEASIISIHDSPMTSIPMETLDSNIDADCLLECNSNGEEDCDFQCTYISDTEYFSIVNSKYDSSIDPSCLPDCHSCGDTENNSQCFITGAEYLNLVNSNYNCDISCLSEYVSGYDSTCSSSTKESSSISREDYGSDSSTCSEFSVFDIPTYSNSSSYLY